MESIKQFVDAGLSVFIFDYAGFGQSAGKPAESTTYDDATAAWKYITGELGLAPNEIILFGRSLGSAVAIDLAGRKKPVALILESCFTSIAEMGARIYPWLPVRFLTRIRFDSMSKITYVDVPKLFVHSLDDEIVPYGMGRRLYNRASRPKQFVKMRGNHNDAFLMPGSEYEAVLQSFLADLDLPYPGPAPVADHD